MYKRQPFFHCSTGDIFGYNVIEPFGTILFRTGDIVALSTVESEMTPMCKATVNDDKCKKLNSLKHLVRTTVAGLHNYNSKYQKGAIT